MFEKSIFFYIFQKKKASYVIYGGKAVILVKRPVQKKNHLFVLKIGGMVEGRQCNYFGAFEPHSYTQRDFFF